MKDAKRKSDQVGVDGPTNKKKEDHFKKKKIQHNDPSRKRKAKADDHDNDVNTEVKQKKHDDGQTKKQDAGATSSSQQKRALKQERQAHRRHADSVSEAKAIWNKLRLKNNSKEETKQMVDDLVGLIDGKMYEISLQHDASRVVQAALQFGKLEHRTKVVTELCAAGKVADLCRVQYSHFVVMKMIKYCARDDANMRMIVKSLKGEISKLAIHAVGSKVVDSLFRTFPPKLTAPLKQEFYGPHFALFATDMVAAPKKNFIPTLESNIQSAPDKKEPAMEFILSILNKCIEKSLFGSAYFQELFAEYVAVASPSAIRSLVPNVADHSIHMLSTKAGTRGVIACISYGTAKDRKRIMKSLKGYVRSSLLHRDAYLAILRLVQVTDDTVSILKSVLNEVLTLTEKEEKDQESTTKTSPLLEMALHESASKLLLLILCEDADSLRKYLDPYERSLLGEVPTVEENGEQNPTSKKNPETRRSELLQHLRDPLIELTAKHPSELLRCVPGSRVLREVYACFHPKALVDAVVATCVSDLADHETADDKDEEADENTALSLFEDPIGHHSIKNLIIVDASHTQADTAGSACFAKEFYSKLGDRLAKIGSSNRGAFVVTALTKVPTIAPKVLKTIKSEQKTWKQLAAGPGATAGFKALLNEIATTKA